jgi:hypothetical protein
MGDESNYDWDDVTNGDNSQAEINGAHKGKGNDKEDAPAAKRRCISSACIACRRRKSKVGRESGPLSG